MEEETIDYSKLSVDTGIAKGAIVTGYVTIILSGRFKYCWLTQMPSGKREICFTLPGMVR